MKKVKKAPAKQLEKFSKVFFQLGLVLVLYIVYALLEHQTEQQLLVQSLSSNDTTVLYFPDEPQNRYVQKAPKEIPKRKETPPRALDLNDFKIGDDHIIETLLPETFDDDPEVLDIDAVLFLEEPKNSEIETVPFLLIEDAPVYKGCEGLSKEENKKCFDKKMTRFVVRNFDANLAQELGLHSGKHKMYSQFVIDKTGVVIDIIIKAPHPKLEEELDRIIRKLPQFTPGKQRKKPVKVKYTLPISFQVE